MMTIIRHILTSFFISMLLILIVIGVTFSVFPIESFTDIITKKFLNIPYLLLLTLITFTFSTIIGVIISQYWKQRIHSVERNLNHLVNGQTLSFDDNYKELTKVEQELKLVEHKLREQIEHAQRLATERANEREESLQEVVIQERNRLARELHDSVSQQLFAASMMMSAINESTNLDQTSFKQQIQMVEKMIHQSQLEMRALLLHLRPAALKGKSLHEGMKDLLIELTNRIPIDVEWKIESFRIEKGVEDHLFRILQEALSNTLRHAEATKIHVMLIKRDQMIILRVVDNGKGFEMDQVSASSYGLQNMEERAKDLGGSIKMISLLNKGTRIEVKVPTIDREGMDE